MIELKLNINKYATSSDLCFIIDNSKPSGRAGVFKGRAGVGQVNVQQFSNGQHSGSQGLKHLDHLGTHHLGFGR